MSIILYPFKTIVFKTSLSRFEVKDRITSQTYLSDADFKKKDSFKKFFFGEVSEFDFSLQNISNEKRFVQFYDGQIKGVENEVYVFITAKAMRYRRIYAALAILVLLAIGFIANDAFHRGARVLKDPGFVTGCLMLLVFIAFLITRFRIFNTRIANTIQYFRGLLEADCVEEHEVPSIFRT